MSEKIKELIKKLTNEINQWNKEYFELDNPSVSDRVYDSSLKQLIELEEKYPEYVLENSPTKKVGGQSKNKFLKVIHNKAMLSLDKVYNNDEINKFILDIEKASNENVSLFIEPKIDGLSISLKYKDGKLIQAATRGDGKIGEDVTNNVLNIIDDIPSEIDFLDEIEIRGEVYISKKNFELINEKENNKYANPRNLASGTLRQLDNSIVKSRNLSSFMYEIVEPERFGLKSQNEIINFLNKLKFATSKNSALFAIKDKNKIFEFIQNFEQNIKNNLDYEIDGLVIKLNEIDYYKKIGFTSKFPKYATAYKFNEELVETTLEDIFVTIGRTGIATYNAKLKTVLLKGTMVSAATLHNYNYINELNLNINDDVLIKKAGEIIPKVVKVSKKKSTGVFEKILICPYCDSKLVDTKTFNNQICSNQKCPEINIKKIIHFCTKGAMDIEGLGEGIVRIFYKKNFLTKIQDIYKLENHKSEIIKSKGFGNKFWNNLNQGIIESKKVKLENLIFALGINQLGLRNAKLIANHIKQFQNIKNINFNEIENIKDIGPITIEEIKNFLSIQENLDLIDFLISQGINPKIEQKDIKENFFKDKKIVITGTFKSNRDKIKKQLEALGASCLNSISKNTDILLVGLNAGSKLNKAKELNIEIIDEENFDKLLLKIN